MDANNVDELVALITKEKPDVVLNLALPYQDLTIMEACLADAKTNYVDTANYEPLDTPQILNIAGSGPTTSALKPPELPRFWEVALILE